MSKLKEDIKILEERLEEMKRHCKNYEESNCKTSVYLQLKRESEALENILNRLKYLEENRKQSKEYLNEAINLLGCVDELKDDVLINGEPKENN